MGVSSVVGPQASSPCTESATRSESQTVSSAVAVQPSVTEVSCTSCRQDLSLSTEMLESSRQASGSPLSYMGPKFLPHSSSTLVGTQALTVLVSRLTKRPARAGCTCTLTAGSPTERNGTCSSGVEPPGVTQLAGKCSGNAPPP